MRRLEWWTYVLCALALLALTLTVGAYVLFYRLRNVAKVTRKK